MPMTVTASQARATLPELLDRVLAGEEVTITRHGTPVAVVVRPDALRARRADAAFAAAGEIRRTIEEARDSGRGRGRLTRSRAEQLVKEIRADRPGR